MGLNKIWLFVMLLAWQTHPALAASVLFAKSNGDLETDSPPGRHSVLNILDSNPKTAWCSSGSGRGAWIEIQFDEPIDLSSMEIRTGNQSTKGAYRDYSRVLKLEIFDGDLGHPMELEDNRKPQIKKFDPSPTTERVILRLKGGQRGKSKRHTCISDVMFFQGKRPVWKGRKYRKTIKQMARNKDAPDFLGSWVAGPRDSRDKELILGLNSHFRFTQTPSDLTSEQIRLTGTWGMKGSDPQLVVDKKKVPVLVKRSDAGQVLKIKLEDAPMAGVYVYRKAQ